MVGQSKTRRLVYSILALAAVGGACALVAAQSARSQPEAKPITVDADEVATWMEDGKRIVLARGNVLVQQGITQARFEEGVLWIDTTTFQRSRVMRMEVHAEGNVYLENGGEPQRGPRLKFDLSTRGEFKLNSHKSKAVQEARTKDPLYQRAVAERAGPTPSPEKNRTVADPKTPPAEKPAPDPIRDPKVEQTQFRNQPQGPTPPPQPRAGQRPSIPGVGSAPGNNETAPRPRPVLPGQGLLGGPGAPRGSAPLRQFSIAPRTNQPYQARTETLPSGEQAMVVTGGIILHVRDVANVGLVDIEADRLVLWSRGESPQFFENLRRPQGEMGRELEFYLAGNVVIRQQSSNSPEARIIHGDEIYYDVSRNVAVALSADLEFKQPGLPYPVHMKADEIFQVSATQFEAVRATIFASRLPSDPGLTLVIRHATLEEKKVPKRSLFAGLFAGLIGDAEPGPAQTEPQSIVRGENVTFRFEDVPFFYLPFVQADARDPLGPIEDINIGFSRIFGFRIGTTLDLYDLLGLDPLPGTRWRMDVDYLSERGPALGTNFEYAGDKFLGIRSQYTGLFKAWGLRDMGEDILGGGRGGEDHPLWRGRIFWRQMVRELPYGFTVQSQLSALSDKNFLEQYFKPEFDLEYNQSTFTYVKQQNDNWSWSVLAESRLFDWMTQTRWLPRADAYLLGQSFFEMFTYNAWANVGFAQLRPPDQPPGEPPLLLTTTSVDTGRLDFWQELSVPIPLGPFRLAPYGVVDLTHYTEDLTGEDASRVYGGGGVRASLPVSRIYPNVESLLFNVNGIHHKVELSGNYFIAGTNIAFTQLPQLDRLNDDVTDQAIRDITPMQTILNPNPGNGLALATSPIFNPQTYAIRRLVTNRVDTRDDLQVLQMDVRQRWQTKRGFPGQQHIVDWMRLETSASYFPDADRDNFGESFAFFEYNWLWNVGDRTGLASSGWFDPFDLGARVFTVGAFINRPDRTNFFLGYRQIDPVSSKAVTGSVSYILSPKYAVSGATTYDFGTSQALSNTLIVTRMGKDLQFGLGVTYNVLQNNFGLLVQVVPNLAAQKSGQFYGVPTTGSRAMGGLW